MAVLLPVVWLLLPMSVAALMSGCNEFRAPPKAEATKPQSVFVFVCDREQEERVFLGCLEAAKHPALAPAAANDLAETVKACGNAAHQTACKHIKDGVQK